MNRPELRLHALLNHDPDPMLQTIEVASFFQIPGFQVVGLPAPEVAEARERVRAAIEASGLEFPRRRIVLNLSPASIRKRGTGLDLAMALAVLAAGAPPAALRGPRWSAWGELGLDGRIRGVGQLTRLLYASAREGIHGVIVSRAELPCARRAWAEILAARPELGRSSLRLHGVETLEQAWQALNHGESKDEEDSMSSPQDNPRHTVAANKYNSLLPMTPATQRILGVAAAGAHHLLLLGPRGSGKTRSLDWLSALQPPPSPEVLLERRLLAELSPPSASRSTPLDGPRRISPEIRPASLLGSSSQGWIRPGELTLAHGGLLIADEFPEWARDSRESLRGPLENGEVLIQRVQGSATLPARFVLAATGNLCPCGGWPLSSCPPRGASACHCSAARRTDYRDRLSGPILDRIDLMMIVSEDLQPSSEPAASCQLAFAALHEMTQVAHARMLARWGAPSGRLPAELIERLARGVLAEPLKQLSLQPSSSLRARHKILRVALTLAAWDGLELPTLPHLREASCYHADPAILTPPRPKAEAPRELA